MFTNVPRRLVDSSISAPMYWLGVTTLSLTHGSSMVSMSDGFGQQRRVVDDDHARGRAAGGRGTRPTAPTR